MQIELSEQTQRLVEQQIETGDFASPLEVVEQALGFLAQSRLHDFQCLDPATGHEMDKDGLKGLIQEGLDDEAAGRVGPLDIEDTKRRGRERLTTAQPNRC